MYLNAEPAPVWDDLRMPANALKTDDYDDDAGLLEVDFHLLLDTQGSKTEYAK